jgi:peptide/nickel transport system substrate-binding protein
MAEQGHLRTLVDDLRSGTIDRRTFMTRASALGLGTMGAMLLANSSVSAANGYRNGFAIYQGQNGTPAASPVDGAPGAPAEGTENQERGAGGELRLIQWQAPTIMSPHVSSGTKDFLAACPVLEPLIHYAPDATMIPNLVTEIPSVENGLLAEDLTSVTLTLLPDVVWSDGEPFTAEDVVFTIEWVMNPDNNSVNFNSYEAIESAEVIDDLTVKVTFANPNPFWFDPFAGTTTGWVYPKHVLEAGPEAHDAFIINPVGTGPYKVDSFSVNDQVTYTINDLYREPNKPYFNRVILKGGGDAAAAARASIQTGEYHYAWNLQMEPDVLYAMESDDAPGEVLFVENVSVTVERINFNFSDPNTEVDGERSHKDTPHPFLTDDAVRRAIFLGVNREQIVTSFYGPDQQVATNIVYGDEPVISPNTAYEYDPEKAEQVLEEAGWTFADDSKVRSKDGVELRAVFATSVNSVRQKIQSVVKSNLEAIGFAIQIEQIDSAIYFDASEGTEQNIYHFYWDMNLFQSLPNNPRSMSYMENWYAGPEGSNIAQKSNGWNGGNASRWSNADYDATFEAARTEIDPERLTEMFVEMNDIVINNDVTMPLVLVSPRRGISKKLRKENVGRAAFSYDYWNIANWNFLD